MAQPTVAPHADFSDPPTSESTWRAFVQALPDLAMDRPTRALVVAPHPDDETFAVGGTLSMWAEAGTTITVVAVTDGEGSHPWRSELAAERIIEQQQALDTLGITREPIRLGLNDTGVALHEDFLTECLNQEAERLAGADATNGGTGVVIAPWDHDAHSDHDAAGRAAAVAARQSGLDLLAYPTWAWQWATPADFGGLDLRRHRLTPQAQDRKARAGAAFVSQTTSIDGADPILSERFLQRFRSVDEVLIVAQHA